MTILLHKPIGYVSGQAEDGYEPAIVLVDAGQPLAARIRRASAGTPATRAASRRPAGSTSTPPACWC